MESLPLVHHWDFRIVLKKCAFCGKLLMTCQDKGQLANHVFNNSSISLCLGLDGGSREGEDEWTSISAPQILLFPAGETKPAHGVLVLI